MRSTEELLEMKPRDVDLPEDRYFFRVAGALIGSAAADALGWITEFVRGPEHLRKLFGTDRVTEYRTWQKTTGGRFNAYVDVISEGEYSDDTQLTLAVGRSLLADGQADPNHFAKNELPLWLDYGRGGGATINRAARSISRKSVTWHSNFYDSKRDFGSYRQAGANGAAMRIAPVALANASRPANAYLSAWRNSIVTHGHPRAIWGALILTEAIRWLAAGESPKDLPDNLLGFSEKAAVPDDPEIRAWQVQWNRQAASFEGAWESTRTEVLDGLRLLVGTSHPAAVPVLYKRLGCFAKETKGSGTGTVLAALGIFRLLGDDYRAAVETAINQLGSDTDTIGGFVGSMCGASLGYAAIPSSWASKLQDYDYFVRMATEISRIAAGVGMGGRALLPSREGHDSDLPDLLTLLRAKRVSKGERVYHRLFGTGWVESVEAQRLRRKDGGQVVLSFVRFDIGQSCKFHYMEIPSRNRIAGSRRTATPSEDPGPEPESQGTLGL